MSCTDFSFTIVHCNTFYSHRRVCVVLVLFVEAVLCFFFILTAVSFPSASPRKQTSRRPLDIVTILPNANAGPLLKGGEKKKKLVNISSLSFPWSFFFPSGCGHSLTPWSVTWPFGSACLWLMVTNSQSCRPPLGKYGIHYLVSHVGSKVKLKQW